MRAAADGFNACATCGGTGAPPSAPAGACCAAHDDGHRHHRGGRDDGVTSIESLSLVTADGSPATKTKDFTLVVFVRDGCGACRRFAPTLRAFADAESARVDVAAVSCDAADSYACLAHGSSFCVPRWTMREASAGATGGRDERGVAGISGGGCRCWLPLGDDAGGHDVDTVVSMNPSGAVDAWTRGSSGLVPEVIANGVNRLNRVLSACAFSGRERKLNEPSSRKRTRL